MKNINPTDLTNSAHSTENKYRENYAQEPNSQTAEKSNILKKKKASKLARGKREKYFIKKTLLKMNNNSPCPAEEVVQKELGGLG